jgi:hypothetical protein
LRRAVGSYTFDGAARAVRELLGKKVRPDAIFVANDPQKFYNTRAKRQSGGEILSPEHVAHAALFLLSDGLKALNAAEIIADGGAYGKLRFPDRGRGCVRLGAPAGD